MNPFALSFKTPPGIPQQHCLSSHIGGPPKYSYRGATMLSHTACRTNASCAATDSDAGRVDKHRRPLSIYQYGSELDLSPYEESVQRNCPLTTDRASRGFIIASLTTKFHNNCGRLSLIRFTHFWTFDTPPAAYTSYPGERPV